MTPRIVATAEGPAVQVAAGDAALVASAIGRLLASRPEGVPTDPALAPVRRLLLEVERQHDAGEGFARETGEVAVGFDAVSAATAARAMGVTPQAVRKRARLGQLPGARWVGRSWLIPRSVLPEVADVDDVA